jgi:hypothetical protein
MSCHAIQITIEVLGQNVETMVSAYSWYVGNRPAFQFDYDGVTYQIDWDGIRWCLYNTDTGQLEYVNYSQDECPISTLLDWSATSGTLALRTFEIVEAKLNYECGLQFQLDYKGDLLSWLLLPVGTRNGSPRYIFGSPVGTLEISYQGAGVWVLTPFGDYGQILYQLTGGLDPIGSWTNIGMIGVSKGFNTTAGTCFVAGKCDCGIQWNVEVKGTGEIWIWEPVGELNGQNVFQYTVDGQIWSMWYDQGSAWHVTLGDILNGEQFGEITVMKQPAGIGCPDNQYINGDYEWQDFIYRDNFYDVVNSIAVACICRNEDRIFKEYTSIRLPQSFTEENRGVKDCCCKELVLAGGKYTWQNDVTSAWIKLSSDSDSCSIKVYKEGNILANWQPTLVEFVNQPNAYYATVEWKAIIGDDGEGCYKIVIEYDIAGISGSLDWGEYQLKWYSIQSALSTARISAVFDGYHEMEGIDFTASAVPSTLRFYGFIGFRQPNFEIDNVIYGDRQMKRNLRENLNVYEIITEPVDECITKQMIELYLLSENELFISDYNAHNHSYRYQDLPVIVEDSPSLDYTDPFSRKAVVKCKVGDKFKNKRTYY